MRSTRTFNLADFLATCGAVLLAVGVIPFTPVAVGIIIFVGLCNLEWTWSA